MTQVLTPTHSPVEEKIGEPPKKWRNKWRAYRRGMWRDFRTGELTPCEAGEETFARAEWPSKEIAEQKAMVVLLRGKNPGEYLGAFPSE